MMRALLGTAIDYIRQRNLHLWMRGYLRHVLANALSPRTRGRSHLLFALCDHYEPLWGNATIEHGRQRVRAWVEQYPKMASPFRDAEAYPPRHSFFFPGEQYVPDYLEQLAELVAQGFAEVELHLHHDGDTPDELRCAIERYITQYAAHGHLSRDPQGSARYAFIHGNWCLANARADGRYCGVDGELPILFETGCFADFTFPAAPDESQPRIVNQIYWPTGDLGHRRAFEQGQPARVGAVMHDRVLIIQGPLALGTKWGRVPLRIENGHLTGTDPATPSRVRRWVTQRIHVVGRPEWVFVKVYTHGAPETTAASLLGEGGRALHRELAGHYNDGRRWVLHYVTAREMFNIARAAMEGKTGDPAGFRDYLLPPPPAASRPV